MQEWFPSRTTVAVVIVWTAGVVALWAISNTILNEGVTKEDILECVEEGFIPAEQCRETLEELEADEDAVVDIGSTLLVWVAGVVALVWIVRPPRIAEPRPRPRRPRGIGR